MDIARLFDISGKTALVTGGSGGIGYMIATALAQAGCKVFICSRKEKDIEAAADRLKRPAAPGASGAGSAASSSGEAPPPGAEPEAAAGPKPKYYVRCGDKETKQTAKEPQP